MGIGIKCVASLYIYIYIYIRILLVILRILDEDVIQDKHGGNDKKETEKIDKFYFFFVDKCKSWEIRVHHEHSNIYLALHFWESVFFVKFSSLSFLH